MTVRAHCPFTLPEKPVDRYEVRWWEVDTIIPSRPIIAHRAIYYVNASWREVCPDDDRQGAPFVDNWQHFRGEHFDGRNVGWTSIAEPGDHWWRAHATYEAARGAAIKSLRERTNRLLEQHAEAAAALAALLNEVSP